MKILLIILLLSLATLSQAQPLTTGPQAPGNTANCSSCPGTPWVSNPPNWIQFFLPPDSFSTILYYKDFGFSIPAGVTITGVKVYYAGDYLGPQASDTLVQLTHNNTLIGTNIALDSAFAGIARTYGDSLNNWGASLTSSMINDTTFGFGVRIETDVQPINGGLPIPQMTVYYQNPITGIIEEATSQTNRIWYRADDQSLNVFQAPENSLVKIYNLDGKLIYNSIPVSGNKVFLSESLPSGLYIGEIHSAEGSVLNRIKFSVY